MKEIKHFNPNNIEMDSPEAHAKAQKFVMYIAAMFPIQTKNIDPQEMNKIILSYKSRILRYEDFQLRKRLETLKKLIDALAPEVEFFNGALKVAVSNSMALNQLKSRYYATGAAAKSLELSKPDTKKLEKINTKDPIAEVSKLKDLLKG